MQMRAAYIAGLFGLVTAAAGAPVFAQADENAPLSAIDWLSETIEQPEVISAPPSNPPAVNPRATQSTRTPPAGEAPVTQSAVTPPSHCPALGRARTAQHRPVVAANNRASGHALARQ